MLFQEDSHASLSALPGSEQARRMTATSGLRCSELLRLKSALKKNNFIVVDMAG